MLSFVALFLLVFSKILAEQEAGINSAVRTHGSSRAGPATMLGAIVDCSTRVGKEEIVAMEMAIEDLNKQKEQRFTLRVKCSGGDPVQAAQAEIQAKLLKRKEAAAKRERAIAYALANQESSRQQATSISFQPDENNWSWNWLERWMTVRPWENRFLNINIKDVCNTSDYDPADAKKSAHNSVKFEYKQVVSIEYDPSTGRRVFSGFSLQVFDKTA